MSKRKTRAERVAEIASDLRDVIYDLDELKERVENQRDNMSGTPLENTEKFQTLDEAADTLDSISQELDNQASELEGVTF
jgi:hypothetical protein